jgi:serine-type D-Ala-D-Ala carboxypeptidase/endopeptidase
MRIARLCICAGAVVASLVASQGRAQEKQKPGAIVLPTDAEIRGMLAERVEALAGKEDGIGIVVGVIGPRGKRVIAYGHRNQGDPRALDGDTVFETGSVGKVFTALLLTDMVRKGEVALTDPATKYLPAGVKVPERNGRPITLVDLATHRSGLPFMPDEAPVFNGSVGEKESVAKLYGFLARYQLTRDPGGDWNYSNLGYWLLGEALAARTGTDFESLMKTRVFVPLKLRSTAITVTPGLKARIAVGHNAVLQPAVDFNSVSIYAAMKAAGLMVSSVNDMLTVLSVTMGYEHSPLETSMADMLKTRRPIDGSEQALGWVVLGKGDDELITHEGFTWGYASYVAWDPKRRFGVVVFSNQLSGVGDLARHLLRPSLPLEKPMSMKRTEITLEPGVLDGYAGRYATEGEGEFVIAREKDFLTLQLPVDWGLPKFRLRPESSRDFFAAELPVRVTFQTDGEGRVNGVLVYPPRGQHGIPAKRMKTEQ